MNELRRECYLACSMGFECEPREDREVGVKLDARFARPS
jgi:hypothetical protein